ncbi:IS110 family transposase [Frankia sp. Cj3]|uniref:IS110 family transposase n=1 Tax=Frankia sp. Cj3 TaxID=2880976 RepID=UPI001EF5DA58|nr:IS110 family transposase [Frankia sp. Cj3]
MAVNEETEEAGPFVERVAALDIGKAGLVACLRVPSGIGSGRRRQEVTEYTTMTDDLVALADHLICQGVELVVMEATSSYWKPPFYVLEAAGLKVWLVNARHVKNLPGRPKTDKIDAVWLCKVAERGMCSPSFVPDKPLRRLRNLTRYRSALVHEATREKQRLEKLLEDAQVKLSVVASDILGVSGRAMLDALIAGHRDPGALAELARGRMRPKRGELRRAFTGEFDDHHAMLARMMLEHIDQLAARVAALDTEIAAAVAEIDPGGPPAGVDPATGEIPADADEAEATAPGATAAEAARLGLAERLAEIPGLGPAAARVVIAEVGTDTSRFPTPDHLASWAGLAPQARESAGKAKPAKTGKGNRYLAGALGQAVLALARTQTFYGVRYRRIRARRGRQKAVVAVSRSILVTVWHLLDDPDARYRELGADYFDKRADPARQAAGHVRQLERLGFQVALTPREQPAA